MPPYDRVISSALLPIVPDASGIVCPAGQQKADPGAECKAVAGDEHNLGDGDAFVLSFVQQTFLHGNVTNIRLSGHRPSSTLHRDDPDIAPQCWNAFEKQITCEKQPHCANDVPKCSERLHHETSYSPSCSTVR